MDYIQFIYYAYFQLFMIYNLNKWNKKVCESEASEGITLTYY